jgi:hypothetical protein
VSDSDKTSQGQYDITHAAGSRIEHDFLYRAETPSFRIIDIVPDQILGTE